MNVHEHLEFRHLKYIIAIAETGTFSAAAARLHVAQSAISAQIGALEDHLGFQIFDRDNANALTTEGRVLLKYGLESLRTRENIVQTLKAIHAGTLLPLRLGFTPFVQRTLLRSVTELYREILIDCEIRLETGDTDDIVSRVRQDELHAAIVTLPIQIEDIESMVIEQERLVVLMRSDDPLAAYQDVSPSDLDNKICIFTYQRHHPAAYDRLVAMFQEVGITPLPCTPTMNIEHVEWMVNEGVCYSLIRAGRPLPTGLITRGIAGVNWTIDSAFISRPGSRHPALSLFTQEMRKRFRVAPQMQENKPVLSSGFVPEQRERRLAQATGRRPSSAPRMNFASSAIWQSDRGIAKKYWTTKSIDTIFGISRLRPVGGGANVSHKPFSYCPHYSPPC